MTNSNITYPRMTVDERSARRLQGGYPWIFRSEIQQKPKAADGDIVDIFDKKDRFIARGFYNSVPQLSCRVLTLDQTQIIDADFIEGVIARADAWRRTAFDGSPFYRLIHAESDGLPGLIVDRYGDILVAQVNTAGMEKMFPMVNAALQKILSPSAILLRNDSAAREMEGLPKESATAFGTAPTTPVKIIENDTVFMIDVMEGQKTGWFFDQRQNRADVARIARGKTMIDVFCHTGGFGITALKTGAQKVCFVDASEKALADAAKNAAANGVGDKIELIAGRAFDELEKLLAAKRVFDVVCVDPPAFIKSRKDMNVGMKGYAKLAKLAAGLVAPGGTLFFASCSHHADVAELAATVAESLARSKRPFQLVRTAGAGVDHPVHPFLPETGYLKALTFRFMD